MAINDMNEGVGRKIVEALKMQSAVHADGEVFVNDSAPEIVEEPVETEQHDVEEEPEIVDEDPEVEWINVIDLVSL